MDPTNAPDALIATVSAVAVFPVKGMDAVPATHLVLDADGVVGDRRHAVLTADGALLTAEEEPRLRGVAAGLDDAGTPALRLPGAAAALHGPAADEALSGHLGRPVAVRPVATSVTLDAPVHLVSTQALDAARRGEHEVADCACSLEEPRSNLVLDLQDPAGREEDWIGRRLRVGGAVLRVQRRPGHCLGVYAEVAEPGVVRAGDVVHLLD